MKRITALLVLWILLFGCVLPGQETAGREQGTGDGQPVARPPGPPVQEPVANITLPEVPQPGPAIVPPPQTSDRQRLIEWYVFNKLMGAEGGVKSASDVNEYSSGSIWLVMEYALETGDKALFDREFGFLMDRQLDGTYSLAHAELDHSFAPVRKSGSFYAATGNDIRIARMLYEAKDKWGGAEYGNAAKRISDSLLAHAVFNNVLVKEVYWGGGSIVPATRMRTADPEWKVMQRLAAESREWTSVMERTRSHTLGCRESGLFWPEYNVANLMCDYGAGMGSAKTTDIITAAISFADISALEPAIVTFTKLSNEYNREEIISEAYTIPFNGVGNKAENPATYALMGRLAVKLERCDFAESMRDEMLEYFVGDVDSPLYGSIAFGGRAYAYDNLQALLFLEEYEEKCG